MPALDFAKPAASKLVVDRGQPTSRVSLGVDQLPIK
jgi:hypothetical protein